MRKDAQPPTGGIYRPRHPRASPLYQCVRRHSDDLDATGLVHRPVEAEALERFLDCGDQHKGFARVFCDQCRHDYLLAYSCKTRYFCPSCHQKRRDSWVLTRLSTIYSILDGTWSRLNAIEISGSVRSINGARQLHKPGRQSSAI